MTWPWKFPLRVHHDITGFVRLSVRWSFSTSRKVGQRASWNPNVYLSVLGRGLGGALGVDEGWPSQPTCLLQYCEPASLVALLLLPNRPWLDCRVPGLFKLDPGNYRPDNYSKEKNQTTCFSVFYTQAMRKTKTNRWPFWSSAKDLSNEILLVFLALII